MFLLLEAQEQEQIKQYLSIINLIYTPNYFSSKISSPESSEVISKSSLMYLLILSSLTIYLNYSKSICV